VRLPIPRWLRATLTSAALVAAVTAVIALLDPRVPALGLGVLYLFAVVPIGLAYGLAAAGAVSVASMGALNYFFLAPTDSLNPGTTEQWAVLAAFLGSSLVISELAARSQREARRSARLAEEQAALRRVATLVARAVPPPDVFAAVVREVGQLLGADATRMERYEPHGTTAVAAWSAAGERLPVGRRVELEGANVAGLVQRTGRPARVHYESATGARAPAGRELGLRSAVGAPIVVDQRLWGVMIAASKGDRELPADAAPRIAAFTELLATAIANAESRTALARLAEEQAALRRVATLVARGAPPEELFAAVVAEVERVFPVESAGMARYEPDGSTMTTVAISNRLAASFPVGGRWPLGGKNVSTIVFETARPARIDDYGDASGRLGLAMREQTLSSSVGAPIVVEGRIWGLITLASMEGSLPTDSEARLASFTELVATAISNTEARKEVTASRARIVAATDEERRRVVRDLHDGAQQRLIHTIITLKLAQQAMENQEDYLSALVTEALEHAEQTTVELRELAHGILPGALTRGGLSAGVAALASRMPMPVHTDVSVGRLASAVEATAYFVIAEALTNVAKHARAGHATITARVEDHTFHVQVRDDGIGGARLEGSGLVGLADRLAALDGRLRVENPADGGTLVAAEIPLPG
jgi:signal transduction histidine kinase